MKIKYTAIMVSVIASLGAEHLSFGAVPYCGAVKFEEELLQDPSRPWNDKHQLVYVNGRFSDVYNPVVRTAGVYRDPGLAVGLGINYDKNDDYNCTCDKAGLPYGKAVKIISDRGSYSCVYEGNLKAITDRSSWLGWRQFDPNKDLPPKGNGNYDTYTHMTCSASDAGNEIVCTDPKDSQKKGWCKCKKGGISPQWSYYW